MTRLSRQGRTVLEVLGQQLGCRFPISYLVGHFLSAHGSAASTRASLSRTLRRLWRAGLVELTNDWGRTLTDYYAAIDEELAAQERDPEAAFAAVLAAIAGAPGFFPYETAEEYLASERRRIARLRRGKPMRAVCLTPQGRELVQRLTVRRREVNRSEHIA